LKKTVSIVTMLAAALASSALAFPADPPDLETLIRELRAINPDRRAKAAEALGELGSRAMPAVRSLTAALTDPSRKVQLEALLALERIGPDARTAVTDLVSILKGDATDLHSGAIAALAAIGHDAGDAVPALVGVLEGEDAELATSAGLALARILPAGSDGLRQVIPVLVKSLKSDEADVRREAVAGLGAAGRVALPALIRLVRNQAVDPGSAWQAAAALQMLGTLAEPALSVLVDALQSDNEMVVVHAAGALGAIGAAAESAIPDLQKLLAHDRPAIRTHAASALGDLGPTAEGAVGDLASALDDADDGVRREAAEALGKIGPGAKPAIPALMRALNDDSGAVTVHAAWALSRIGPDAVPELLTALKDDEKLRHLIVVILGDLKEAAAPAAETLAEFLARPDLDEDFGREIMVALARIGPQAKAAVPVLMKILEDQENPLRAGAAYALAKLGARQAQRLLIQALPREDDPEMRVVAPIALVLLSPDSDVLVALALPRLIMLLADDSNLVRHEAATTLARIGPRAADAAPVLIAGVADPDPALREAYLSALGEIGPDGADAMPAITKGLADPDFPVRYSASYAAGKFGAAAQTAIPLLEANLKIRDEFLQIVSAWALVNINPRMTGLAELCVAPLTRGLKSSDARVRAQSAEALGMMRSAASGAAAALEELTRDADKDVRNAAAAALRKIAR
jgi:HEAT repeat protein